MHPNPAFRRGDAAIALRHAREVGFGMLAISGRDGPLLAHVPFRLDDGGATADLHLVRSSPILKATPCEAVMAVTGPDGYVSPDWYGLPDQVPTWNYVAVHLRGRLTVLERDELRAVLDRQSSEMEGRLRPKPPWRADKMAPEALARMMRQIVPCRVAIDSVDATWKLGQNKPDAARMAAADRIDAAGGGSLAALMRDPPA